VKYGKLFRKKIAYDTVILPDFIYLLILINMWRPNTVDTVVKH